jgi:glycopeptide antibiotics resistance protein
METALNLLAFIPVGYLGVRSFSPSSRSPVLMALFVGLCSSTSIEFYQLFCHDRVPATTDVFMNVTGTAIGVWLAFAIDHVFTFWTIYIRRLSSNSSRDEARFPS